MALKGIGSSSDSELEPSLIAEINITPLTDIFLVLLIIFMVTSSVMSQLGMNVELPKTEPSTSEIQPGGVILTLLPDGGMKLNDRAIAAGNWDALEQSLSQAFKQTDSRLVILEGDRRVLLGSAIELMDRARKVGAQKFAIATAPAGLK